MNHSSMNGVSLANFAVTNQSAVPNFQHAGWWYEYFTGDSINVVNALSPLDMAPGTYRIYTDVKLPKPVITEAPASIEEILNSDFDLQLFPNPVLETAKIEFATNAIESYKLLVINVEGKIVHQKIGLTQNGSNQIDLNVAELPQGTYHILLQVGKSYANQEFVKVH
jgi:hypothetical protein